MPSSGRTAGRHRSAASSRRKAWKRPSPERPACCSIPIFPAPRSRWLLDNVEGVRKRGRKKPCKLAVWHGRQLPDLAADRRSNGHVTDATNACAHALCTTSRDNAWDADICWKLLEHSDAESLLPEVLDCAADFGVTDAGASSVSELPDSGCARRPAGRHHRPGLFRAGHVQVDLRHRMFRADQHGRHALVTLDQPAA